MEGWGEKKDVEKRVEVLGRLQTEGEGRSSPRRGVIGFSINKRLVSGRQFATTISTRGILHSVTLGKH